MMNRIETAQKVIDIEVFALTELRKSIDENFITILKNVTQCSGKVITCGMGKSGHVAKKMAATLSSLGTPSFFLHPAEAQHGDMGMVGLDDVILLISNSGETKEIIDILPSIKSIGAKTIAVTSNRVSTLAKECDLSQIMPDAPEACSLKLAPTSSTTAVMAWGDALAVAASEEYGFTKEDFGLFHPAGSLGKKLLIRVNDIMAKDIDIPIVRIDSKITDAIVEMSNKTLGMLIIVDENNFLKGVVTDGDLRRAIEKKVDLYDGKVNEIMTNNPRSITDDILAISALQKLKSMSINNFPVVDGDNHVVGAITWQMIIKAGIVI